MNTCANCRTDYDPTEEGVTVQLEGAPLDLCGTCMEDTDELFYCGHCYTTYHVNDEDREMESVCASCAREAREARVG